MRQGATNKRKGSNAERLYAKLFRELGYTFCKTARQESRVTDDAGVDLTNLPWNVQIKAGFQKNMSAAKVLSIIDERLPQLFPPEDTIHTKPNILIHTNQIGQGKKRVPTDDLVYMDSKDFSKLFNSNTEIQLCPITKHGNKRKWTEKSVLEEHECSTGIKILIHTKKVNLDRKYNQLVVMSFLDFTKLIKK